jgi:peroxiredoxin Q/BCP
VTARSTLIPVGEPAPDFTAPLSDGGTIALAGFRAHKRVVLVFYPGDNTPGCTAQLCALRDDWSRIAGATAAVYGVNPAGADRHARFADRYHLPFPLIVDAHGEIAAAYGCRALFGIVRRTVYIVDGQGLIGFAQRGAPSPDVLLQTLHGLRDGLK